MPQTFIKDYPIITKTDRDVEIPNIIEFVKDKKPSSLLDIGGHYSYNYYAKLIRPYITRYDAIDILDDQYTREIVNNYYVGNVNTYNLEKYDMVICVSTIEHSGISTYKSNHKTEMNLLFQRCIDLANKWIWISFPVGQPYVYPDELSIVTKEDLEYFGNLIKDYKVKEKYFYSQGPQAGHPWREHLDRDLAIRIPFIDFIGAQSLAILEIEKV